MKGKSKIFKKVLTSVLCAVMLLGAIPFASFASAAEEFQSETHTVFKNTETTLAPGVTQNIKYAYAKSDGNQMVYYIATADVTRDDVVLQTSYYKQHEGGVLGMQKLIDQAAYANKKYSNPDDPGFISEYYNVVAGTNASFYHMGTGQPTGITFVDGVSFGTNSYDNFFAILKDGKTAVIDYASNLGKYVDENGNSTIWQAAAGSAWLVRDGKDVTANASGSYNTDRHSRTCVGVTADGKVVLMSLDGRQVPFSCGGTFHELAQIMLEAGCVAAVNLDGGGSTTFISKPAGSDELQLINRPSDGSERSISSGLIIASTAAPTDKFDSAVLTAESEYVTPGSTVKISATGVSPVGTSAKIPADAILQVKDASMGSVVDGAFVSNGTVGDATVQMVYDGKVVGETVIHVVIPDIKFSSSPLTVPYDTTFTFDITATVNNGLNTVTVKPEDFTYEYDTKIGTISGLTYTTCSETSGVTGGTITAKCRWDESKTASVEVKFGKASEILWDFEEAKDASDFTAIAFGWPQTGYPNTAYRYDNVSVGHATAANGKVHDGNGSLRFQVNVTDMATPVNQSMRFLLMPKERKVIEGATSVGVWVYIPNELWTDRPRLILRELDENGNLKNINPIEQMMAADLYNIVEEGGNEGKWVYFKAGIDPEKKYVLGNYADLNDNRGFIDFRWHTSQPNSAEWKDKMFGAGTTNGKYTIYIDSVQVDYSEAVADREAPTITEMVVLNEGESVTELTKNLLNTVECEMLTVNSNVISLRAKIAEDTAKTNYTGLDYTSAKILVDGVETPIKASGTYMTLTDYAVADGVHRITFVIKDKQGNETRKTRWLNVQSGVDASTVKLEPQDPSLKKLLNGSLYWVNLNANKIETIQSVTAVIDKNSVNHWELEHMVVADGFTATWSVDPYEETATITITRTGENTQTGEAPLAQLPIRIIDWDDIYKETEKEYWESAVGGTAEGFKAGRQNDNVFAWPHDLKLEILRGEITFVEGYTSSVANTFANEYFRVDTLWYQHPSTIYNEMKGNWLHIHTTTSVPDTTATCTTDGHTGRTYCAGCKSIIDWGTESKATGHNHDMVDGVLKCTVCGTPCNGKHTDEKYYFNGIIASGWVGESYYVNGAKLTGLQLIDGYYYDFGTNGVCSGKAKLNDFYYDASVNGYRYFVAGIMTTGDVRIGTKIHFFDENGVAVSGEKTINGYNCQFNAKGYFVSAEDDSVLEAGYVGTNLQYVLLSDGTLIIDGDGKMRNYTTNGVYGPWYYAHMTDVKNVRIGANVTSIGEAAFNQCNYLKSITFAENSKLERISVYAFRACHRLETISIPASVKEIANYAFFKCGALTAVEFTEDSSLKTIGNEAFAETHCLKQISIPAGVTSIGERLFLRGVSDIKLFVVKDSQAYFYAINHGIAYELVDGVVPPSKFGNCSANVTWALYPNGTLEISGNGEIPNYASQAEQPWANDRHLVKKIVIGKDITVIGNYAFAYCENNEAIVFEDGSKLEKVGLLSFRSNKKLTSVTLPETVTYLNSYAFGTCTSLESVYVSQGMSFIHAKAFTQTLSVVLNVALGTYAENYAKTNGISYTTRAFVYIPSAQGTCGDNATWAFYENGELRIGGSGAICDYADHRQQPWASIRHLIKKIVIGKDITVIGNYAFAYCENNEEIVFEEGSKLEKIGILAFRSNRKITEVTLPESVTYMNTYAFGTCDSLTSIYIPQGMSFMHAKAFIETPDVVLNVAVGTYAENYAKTNGVSYTTREFVYVPSMQGTCGDNATWAFYENGELRIGGSGAICDYADHRQQPWASIRHLIKKIVIGKDITVIGNYAFAYCENNEEIVFEEGSKLEKIGILAFRSNRKITEVTLPESVTYLNTYAFGTCDSLTSIYIPQGMSFMHAKAFTESPMVTLKVASDSYAEQYATEQGFAYYCR